MITNFKQYHLILEKSTLIKFFNSDELSFLYKHIILKHNSKIIELDFKEEIKIVDYIKQYINICLLLTDSNNTYILYKNYDGHRFNLYLYNKNTKKYDRLDYSIEYIIQYIYKNIFFENLKIYNIEVEPKDISKEVWDDKLYHVDLLINTINLYYGNLFKKFYTEYFNMIKQLKKENLDTIEDLNTDEYEFYKQLNRDFEISLQLKNDYLYLIKDDLSIYDRTSKIKEYLAIIVDNINSKNYDEFNYSFSDFYKTIENNTYSIASKMARLIFLENNSKLYILRNKYYDILLEKDPSKWSEFKYKFFDKKLKDKWKHLDNAKNFDIL